MKVGWAKVTADPSAELGTDGTSYAFDGWMVSLKHTRTHLSDEIKREITKVSLRNGCSTNRAFC